MTTEQEIAARIIKLDADLDQVIQFRGERLAEEIDTIEFYAPQQQDGVLKKTAKVGAGVAAVGTAGLVGKSMYDAKSDRFDKAAEGFKGNADQKAGMAKRVKGWKGKSSAGRFGSAVQSNLRKVDKVPGLGKAGLGGKAAGLVGKGVKRIFGR
jgi:hypothetical protein